MYFQSSNLVTYTYADNPKTICATTINAKTTIGKHKRLNTSSDPSDEILDHVQINTRVDAAASNVRTAHFSPPPKASTANIKVAESPAISRVSLTTPQRSE